MILYTIGISIICVILMCLIVLICQKLGINVGNANSDIIAKSIKDSKFTSFILGCIFAPIVEEILFRGIPTEFTSNLFVGFIISIIFAVAHGLKDEDNKVIWPIPQFLMGLTYWILTVNYGLEYAVLCHMTFNGILWGILITVENE